MIASPRLNVAQLALDVELGRQHAEVESLLADMRQTAARIAEGTAILRYRAATKSAGVFAPRVIKGWLE